MKSDKLLDAIGMISDEYVQDAKSVRVVKKSHPWLKWSAMAACACVLVYLGVQSGFGGGYGQETTANDAGNSMNAGSAQSTGNSSNDSYMGTESNEMASDNWQESASVEGNQDSYPYNDTYVLDYVGMELADVETENGAIVFNEITDVDMYRQLNNLSMEEDTVYYDTRNSLYQSLVLQEDAKYFKEEACKPDNSPEGWTHIVSYLLAENCLDNVVEGVICDSVETVALQARVADSPNGKVTILAGKDLDALGAKVQEFVTPMREALGTGQGSLVSGQEVAVYYFYQHRMFRGEILEECYHYYAYFEKDDVEYLYQYSSNWTLPGEAVTAIHNPPHTLSEALSQEESREMFISMLPEIIAFAGVKP